MSRPAPVLSSRRRLSVTAAATLLIAFSGCTSRGGYFTPSSPAEGPDPIPIGADVEGSTGLVVGTAAGLEARWLNPTDPSWDPAVPVAAGLGGPSWLAACEADGRSLVAVLAGDGSSSTLSLLERAREWNAPLPEVATHALDPSRRSFDLATETTSGEVLLLFSDGTADLQYRRFAAGEWGPAESVDPLATASAAVQWVRLVAHPWRDELTGTWADADQVLWAAIWDGDTWSTPEVLESPLRSISHPTFDAIYEQQSGELLAVWASARSYGYTWTTRPDGGSFGPAFDDISTNAPAGPFALAADPVSDRVVVAYLEYGFGGADDLILETWDGDGWADMVVADSEINDYEPIPGSQPLAAAWLGETGEAIAVWDDSGVDGLEWALWSEGVGWERQPDVTTSVPITAAVAMQAIPEETGNGVLLLINDTSGALHAKRLRDGVWSDTVPVPPLATGLNTSGGRPFVAVAH